VAPLTPEQLRTRDRVESVIRLAAPALNLVLAAGERLSKLVEPDDPEYYPPRSRRDEGPPSRRSEPPAGPAGDSSPRSGTDASTE
jgi:hypothetical protein